MSRILAFCCVTIFSIFLGSQITEGALLVPYWQSLSPEQFNEYYNDFGSMIGQFYTILTISAALIPLLISIYCLYKKSPALKYSLISTLFSILVIAFFYVYFKGINQQFYNIIFTPEQLKTELITWEYWHWARVFLEFLSLIFLTLTLNILTKQNIKKAI